MTKLSHFRARRRSAAEKRLLLPLQREIGSVDRLGRRKYLQEFTQAYPRYERIIPKSELLRFCAQAGTLLISDFHALDTCQFFLCEVLEELAQSQSRPLVLLLEAVFTRDQHIVDDWQAGRISDGELKSRLRFVLEWGYEWEPFLHTLKVARDLDIPIIGADCPPRGSLRRIGRRDRHAAEIAARVRRAMPDALVVVFFGESHLAPSHLPREIERCLPGEDFRAVLQNVDSLYFRAAGEFAHTVDAVLVNANTAAVFNATPVEKWQSYRLAIERWREESQRHPDVTPLIYDLIDALLDLLRIDRYEDDEEAQRYFVDCYPEVTYYSSVEDARVFVARSTLPLSQRNQYLLELMETGSTYIPNLNLLAVHRLRMAAAARNVGRFVHHACRRFEAMDAAQQSGDDSLYARALAEAMEQFCARLLYPSQPVVDDAHLISFYEDEASMRVHLAPAEHARVLDCALQHRDFELHARSYAVEPQRLREIAAWPGAMQAALATYLGQMLAGDLYRAYVEGELTRSEARAMMFRPLSKEARNLYFTLARRVRRRPARSAA